LLIMVPQQRKVKGIREEENTYETNDIQNAPMP